MKKLASFFVIAAMLLSLASCTEKLTAYSLLFEAEEKLENAQSGHADINVEMTMGVKTIMDMSMDFNGDNYKMVSKTKIGNEEMTINMILADGIMYQDDGDMKIKYTATDDDKDDIDDFLIDIDEVRMENVEIKEEGDNYSISVSLTNEEMKELMDEDDFPGVTSVTYSNGKVDFTISKDKNIKSMYIYFEFEIVAGGTTFSGDMKMNIELSEINNVAPITKPADANSYITTSNPGTL